MIKKMVLACVGTMIMSGSVLAFDDFNDNKEVILLDSKSISFFGYGEKEPVVFNYSTNGASKFCTSCHGDIGNLSTATMPKIQGMPKDYIKKQLLSFKTKERVSPEMNGIMPYISEAQIEELADFYSRR